MLARAAILAVCALVLFALGGALGDARACDAARAEVFGVAIGRLSPAREDGALRRLESRCRGTDGLVAAAAALDRQGRRREALALAFRATRREPSAATAWDALARIAAGLGRRSLALGAAARARALSPLGRAPLPAPTTPPPGGPDGGP